jgi:hypothetical protein
MKSGTKKNIMSVIAGTIAVVFLTQVIAVSIVEAHSGKLLNINGKDYWVWVAIKEDANYVNTISAADVYIYEADPSDPLNGDSLNTKPVEGMENLLKVDIVANGQNRTLDLVPVWNSTGLEVGHYEAPAVFTAETTYDIKLVGDWNGTRFDVAWSCTPGEVPETPQENSTSTLSEGVTQKAQGGGFSCPTPLSEISVPASVS